jgi:hypothetical protein
MGTCARFQLRQEGLEPQTTGPGLTQREPWTLRQHAHLVPVSQKNECLSQVLAQARVQNPSVGVQQLDQLLAEGCGFLRVTRCHLHAEEKKTLDPLTHSSALGCLEMCSSLLSSAWINRCAAHWARGIRIRFPNNADSQNTSRSHHLDKKIKWSSPSCTDQSLYS